MVDWRAVAYGLVVFPVVVVASLPDSAPLILLSGFPSGLVAGYRVGGLLRGLMYGFVTGCGVALLFLGGVWYVVDASASAPAYPGVGLAIVLVLLVAVLLAVESTVAGVVGGLLGR